MKGVLVILALLALGGNARNLEANKGKGEVHHNDFNMEQPLIFLLPNGGLRMAYPAEDGMTLFAVHYSVNKPLPGVAPGDYNFDVTEITDGYFVHDNTELGLVIGDLLNYWVYALVNGAGYQLLDQQWVVQETTTPVTTTPGPTTTTASTTTVSTASTTTTTTVSTSTVSTTPFTGTFPTGVPTDSPIDPECTEYPCLIFEDNFDTFNLNTWEHEISMSGGGNWEFQYYTNNRTNSYTRDGKLFIKPTLTSDMYGEAFLTSGTLDLWGMAPPNYCTANAFYGCLRVGNPSNLINPAQSARLRTVGSFNVKYGKIEVEAQLPKGDWLWPAIWMLPKHEAYGGWPASGEIDLVESRGNLDLSFEGESKGNDMAGATMHWGPFWPYNAYLKTTGERHTDFADSMHRYGVEWDEDYISLLIDDEVVVNVVPSDGGFWEIGDFGLPDNSNPWRYSSKMAPFDQPFYFVMNVAVGGTNGFFPDVWTSNPRKPWNNNSPTAFRDFWEARNDWYPTWNPDVENGEQAAMKVNYVRVWKTRPGQ